MTKNKVKSIKMAVFMFGLMLTVAAYGSNIAGETEVAQAATTTVTPKVDMLLSPVDKPMPLSSGVYSIYSHNNYAITYDTGSAAVYGVTLTYSDSTGNILKSDYYDYSNIGDASGSKLIMIGIGTEDFQTIPVNYEEGETYTITITPSTTNNDDIISDDDADIIINDEGFTDPITGNNTPVKNDTLIKDITLRFKVYSELSDDFDETASSSNRMGEYCELEAHGCGGLTTAYTYQWQEGVEGDADEDDPFADNTIWENIPGETKSTIRILCCPENDEKRYRCIVSDGFSSVSNGYNYLSVICDIEYVENYSSGKTVLSGSVYYSEGKDYRIIDLSPNAREGYVFKGWATSPTAKIPEYQPGDVCHITDNTTFYAVWSRVTGMDVDPKPIYIVRGKSVDIITSGQVQAFDGANFTFKSSNPSVVSVDSSGIAKAKKYGKVKITITAQADATHESCSGSVTVYVKPPKVTKLKIKKKSDGYKVTWKKLSGAKYIVYVKNSKETRRFKCSKNSIKLPKKAKGYKVYVQAYVKSGGKKLYGKKSNKKSI